METPLIYPPRADERIMQRKQVIEMAVQGKISWIQAAEILKVTTRQMRRIRKRFEKLGEKGLSDFRRRPSSQKISEDLRNRVVELYRSEYRDFSVLHFYEMMQRKHHLKPGGYYWVLRILQEAGVVMKHGRRTHHRTRRDRRPMPGMLVQLDGSSHAWLGPDHPKCDLLITIDDADSRIHSAEFTSESTIGCMRIIRVMTEEKGICCALYVDRARHFVFTGKAGEKPDRSKKTHLEKALDRLGISLIAAYSPQAKGRVERAFRTIQGRLPQELRIEGIDNYEKANRYLKEKFLPWWNENLTVSPTEKDATAFTMVHPGVSLDHVFSIQYEREVNWDNTVQFKNRILQIPKLTHLKFSFAGTKVRIHEHTDRTLSITFGPHELARYDREGKILKFHSSQPMKMTG